MKTQKESILKYNSQEELFSMLRRHHRSAMAGFLKLSRTWFPSLSRSLYAMKSPSGIPVYESQEFKTWLAAQSAQAESDYRHTVFYRTRAMKKKRKYYRVVSVVLIVCNLLLLLTLVS